MGQTYPVQYKTRTRRGVSLSHKFSICTTNWFLYNTDNTSYSVFSNSDNGDVKPIVSSNI